MCYDFTIANFSKTGQAIGYFRRKFVYYSALTIKYMKDKEKFREGVLQASASIFRERGYAKTTMREVARHVNMGKSSLYYYFDGKESLFKAVVLEEAKQFRTEMIAAIDQAPDPKEKLKVYVLTRMQILRHYANFYTAMTDEAMKKMQFVRKLHKIYHKEEVRLFRNILQEGVAARHFEIGDIWMAALAMVMAMRGIEERLLCQENSKRFELQVDGIINVIFYGILKRRGR